MSVRIFTETNKHTIKIYTEFNLRQKCILELAALFWHRSIVTWTITEVKVESDQARICLV